MENYIDPDQTPHVPSVFIHLILGAPALKKYVYDTRRVPLISFIVSNGENVLNMEQDCA